MSIDKNTLLQEEDASVKRKLMSVSVEVVQTLLWISLQKVMLMRTPTQAKFVGCWREDIIRNGLPPVLVDDPLFRKSLVTTSHMGQTSVCMGKGTALGKRDTTLPHHDTFTRKIIGTWIRVSSRISGQ
jgi:hypothetical protein